MAQSVTLQQIADAANVSSATVSRALNKTGKVSPEVERRIRTAMARLGAVPRSGESTRTLCFLLANRPMLHPFHAQALMGAQELASEHESHILFLPFHYSASAPPEDVWLPPLLNRRGLIDGYIVGGMNTQNLLELLARTGVPFAVLGNNVQGPWDDSGYDVVWMDDIAGSYEATRYLQSLGHRDIGFISIRALPKGRLLEGYKKATAEARLQTFLRESDASTERDAGYLAAKSLLTDSPEVSAIVCVNDAVALGVYEAAAASNRSIPGDLSVIGFGDRPEAVTMTPPLTTVWGYPDLVGRRLAEMVLKRLSDPEAPPQKAVTLTRLIERSSCARRRPSAPDSDQGKHLQLASV